MKSILISTGEAESPRWGRLCSCLGLKSTEEQYAAFGHLMRWCLCWASKDETDWGVWFGASMNEIGSWAGVEGKDAHWGRALLTAGYIGLLKDVYPEPLGSIRKGYVALDGSGGVMLDTSFSILSRRGNASTYVLYLTNREDRSSRAVKLGIDHVALESTGQIPIGWLTGKVKQNARQNREQDMAAAAIPRESEPMEDLGRGGSIAAGCYGRPVMGFAGVEHQTAGASAAAYPAQTAPSPSSAMLRTVREFKYSDPLRALRAIDPSPNALFVWNRVLSKNRELVCQELGTITETDQQWARLRNPAGVITANFRRLGLLDK